MADVILNTLIGLEIFVAIVLGFLIMIQRSKSGGGLGGLSGGGATEEVLGAGGASMVVKATVVFSLVFLVNTLTIASLQSRIIGEGDMVDKMLLDETGETTAPAETPADAAPVSFDTQSPDAGSDASPAPAPSSTEQPAEVPGDSMGAAPASEETETTPAP